MTEPADVYRAARQRIVALTRQLDDGQLAAPVAACPGWTVRDLLAHLAGLPADIAAGRVEGAGTDPWTAAQVAARRDATLDEVLAEWETHASALEGFLPSMPRPLPAIDVVCHEHDIRGALGMPGESDREAVDFVLENGLSAVAHRIGKAGLPALEMSIDGDSRTLGEGEAAATVRLSRYEAFRALMGRRSLDQLRAYDWEGGAEPYVGLLPSLPAASAALVE